MEMLLSVLNSPLSLSRVNNPYPGWYRGDFHCHTTGLDGVLTPPELAQLGRGERLDFFAITDHNTIGAYADSGPNAGLLLIPGIEVTYKCGHFNIFGIEAEHDWLAPLDAIELSALRASDKHPSLR